jgi:SAM-dependent methyltransferase
MSDWYDDLCEYYGVTPEQAIELGTRKTGRRPNLPSSKTTHAVGGKNFEELWDMNSRDTIQQKMDFYKDIGAWQVFRQCNYRRKFNYKELIFPYLTPVSSIVEYGCGVAPLTNYIIEHYGDIGKMKFSLVDVAGEHLEFAKWRLKKKAPYVDFDFHEITSEYIVPNFDRNFDIVSVMDVFEHLPNPYDVMVNLYNYTNDNAIMVETWVDKAHGEAHGPDLIEAERQRDITVSFIDKCFNCVKKGSIRVHSKK